MKRFPILLGTASLIVMAACSHEQAAVTRGIGVYPGNPDESAAPSLVKGDGTYRNIALGRTTYQSSSYDYNLTSQLITDGIAGSGPVAYVDLTAGGKLVDKPNHEKLFDGKPDSRIHFDAAAPTVRVDFRGMPVAADRVEVLGRVADAPGLFRRLLLEGARKGSGSEAFRGSGSALPLQHGRSGGGRPFAGQVPL